jgi:hypothetical protein
LASGGNFSFSFQTLAGQTYTVQQNTNLATQSWIAYTNFTADGSLFQLTVPMTGTRPCFFRVREF